MITVVSSYFNDHKLLRDFWVPFVRKNERHAKFIFVDDYSLEEKAIDILGPEKIPNVSLYYVTEDKKFNSHGARNLGVSESSTNIVLMTDIDAMPVDGYLKRIKREKGNFLFWPVWEGGGRYHGTATPNTFTVERDKFVAIKGYDEECSGPGGYGGDYWTRNNYINVYQPRLIREGAVHFLEEYNGERLDNKTTDRKRDANLKQMVYERNARRDWFNKPWLDFSWERLL